MKKKYFGLIIVCLCVICYLESCQTVNYISNDNCSLIIYDRGIKSSSQLYKFFIINNNLCDKGKVKRLSKLYVQEARKEGINSDVAFVQMCLETGFLRFGSLVTEDMNNFCGLGAIDLNNKGVSFKTERLGVIAHIQHLKAYGTKEILKGKIIDPRYKYVNPKGKALTVNELAGTWAMDKDYGKKLSNLLDKLSTIE